MLLNEISCITEYTTPIAVYTDEACTQPVAQFKEVQGNGIKTAFLADFDIAAVYLNGKKQLNIEITKNQAVFKSAPDGLVCLIGKHSLKFVNSTVETKELWVTGYGWLVVHDSTETENLLLSLSLDNTTFTAAVPLSGKTKVYCKNSLFTATEMYNLVTNQLFGIYIPENSYITLSTDGTALTALGIDGGIEFYESNI